jgi:hypothetical protein
MRKTRQLHLWIGLICSVFIFIEAVTGLFLLEPQLLGGSAKQGQGAFPQGMQQQQTTNSGAASSDTTTKPIGDANTASPGASANAGSPPSRGNFGPGKQGGGGANNFILNLHEGRIGSADISWVMDIAAIGMIFLTVTGIVLSTKTLAAQRVRKKKQRVEMQE